MLDEYRFGTAHKSTKISPEYLEYQGFQVIFDINEKKAEQNADIKIIYSTLKALQVLLHFIWSGNPESTYTRDHQWQVQDGVKFDLFLDESEELVVSHRPG